MPLRSLHETNNRIHGICFLRSMDILVGGSSLATIAPQGFQSCSLAGRLLPRLRFSLVATRTAWSPDKEAVAFIIGGELVALNEVVGTLEPVVTRLYAGPPHPNFFSLFATVSPRMFAWLNDQQPAADLQFVLKPQVALYLDNAITDGAQIRDITVDVSRSQWHSLLAQANIAEYRVIEIPLPKSADRADAVRAALKLLDNAETLFADGRDAEALARCYNVLEKLLGQGEDAAKELKRIFGDSPRTAALDVIVQKLRVLTHEGRHIPPESQEFRATHPDAEFMIGVARYLIAYVSKSDQETAVP